MKIAAGVLRNDGDGWDLLLNSKHHSVGITEVRTTSHYIDVVHPPNAGVFSVFANPDESLARAGITMGVSGGGSLSRILLFKDGEILDPRQVNTATYPMSNIWFMALQKEMVE